jgi:hypothetical protein
MNPGCTSGVRRAATPEINRREQIRKTAPLAHGGSGLTPKPSIFNTFVSSSSELLC